MTNTILEFENSECIFVIGSNTTENHPLVARYIMKAKEKGAKLILADPRNIVWSKFADIHLTQRCGTDVALLNGLMNVIISEGLEAKEFISTRTEGYDAFKEVIAKYTPEYVEKITGVSKDLIINAAITMAKAKSTALV